MECLTAQRSDTRLHVPIYDPSMSYQDNFDRGPFGEFANGVRFAQTGKPQHSFLGHPVFAPFGVPAGPLLNGKYVKAALDKGFDIPVYKTVRTRRVPCHAWPNVLAVEVEGDLTLDKTRLVANDNYAEPLSITNSFGVPSFDPDFWQPDLAAAVAYAGEGQVVVGSFQGTKSECGGAEDYIADFVLGARLLRETGVKIVEVNLSCPNEGTSALLCFDVERSRKVVEAIKNVLGEIPLLIKVAYFREDAAVEELVRAVSGAVSGICAINTISAEIVDEHGQQALPGEGRLRSGVCGRSIKWAGLEMTQRLHRVREAVGAEISIIGVGGVSDAADYEEYRQAGADAVMSATAMMWNPQLAQQIKREAHEL
jgi:dihydroorotate dehydrogenase